MIKLRFGICGLGAMGRSHFARLRGNPRAEVVAVCDTDPSRRQGNWNDAVGNIAAIRAVGEVDWNSLASYAATAELVADSRVDVVVVALPTSLHADVTVAALNAGKHVFCEKPMAQRPADCDRMIEAAERNGRTLMIGQCIRFWPQYELIRQLVAEGRIGKPACVILHRVGSWPTYSAGNWMLDARQSGGALLDLHVHDVDFIHHMLGLPEAIAARGTNGLSGGIDHIAATFTFPDGTYALLEGGWVSEPWPFDMSISVHGERGTLHWSEREGPDVQLFDGKAIQRIACSGDAYENELEYLIDCILSGRPVTRCLPASTRTSIVLAWLEKRAIETGKVIPIDERLRTAWTG